ncbi:hypothetical protein GSI_11969 [Ganoderma sinense ZZ0214-1]|uniref:Protein kinase domain-containing protein n=1 Tax=Ganoderma sinense ZZ0214-1 TaxID=1077348 RepID=A0A2G8RXJ4_9APHY|nr:hypothetical protein GSI_11969 [Ganoderma sinense ZZ0214-1]
MDSPPSARDHAPDSSTVAEHSLKDGWEAVSSAQGLKSDTSPRLHPRKLPRLGALAVACDPRLSGHSIEIQYSFKLDDLVMTKYRVRSKLGRGSFGTVVLAEDTITGTAVAIKLLHKDPDLHEDVRHEEKVYRTLLAGCDPRIELFAEAITSGTHLGFHCIVFELCGATLYDMVHGCMELLPFPARHVLEIAYQLVNAVDYLHSLGIIHTDLKLDNIAVRDQATTTIRWLSPQTGFEEKADVHDPELVDLLKRLTALDPAKRVALNVAGKHTYFDAIGRSGWQ